MEIASQASPTASQARSTNRLQRFNRLRRATSQAAAASAADSPVAEAAASVAEAAPDDKLPDRSTFFSMQPASSDLAATTVYPLFIV